MALVRPAAFVFFFFAACDQTPEDLAPYRNFAQCAAVHPRSATPNLRRCQLPGASPVLVDLSIDPSHCGDCFRACAGCAAGECPNDAPSTIRLGSSGDDVLHDVAAMDGRVAIVGAFALPEEGIDPSAIALGNELVESRGASDGLLVVYDAQLRLQWSLTVGGEGRDEVRRVALGRDGSIAIAGSFWRSAEFGSLPLVMGEERDGFVAMVTPEGSLLWTQTVGGAADERITALAFDEEGGLLIGGASTGRELRVGAETVRGPEDHAGAWIASLTSAGAFRWARAFGGEPYLDEYNTATDSTVDDIAVSADGLIVAVGYVGQNADFGEGARTTMGAVDGFVTALGRDGTLRWVLSPYARVTSDYVDRARALDDGTFLVNGGGPLRERDPSLRSGLMRLDPAGAEVALDGNEIVPGTAELRQNNLYLRLPSRTAASNGVFFAADSVTRIVGSRGDVTAPDIVLARIPCFEMECEPVWLPERCDVTPTTCGDGVNNLNEFCDRGDQNGTYGSCGFDCLRPAETCGDRIVQTEHEECDRNRRADGTRCDVNCRWEL